MQCQIFRQFEGEAMLFTNMKDRHWKFAWMYDGLIPFHVIIHSLNNTFFLHFNWMRSQSFLSMTHCVSGSSWVDPEKIVAPY